MPVINLCIRVTPKIELKVIKASMKPINRLKWDTSCQKFNDYPNEEEKNKSSAYVELKFPWPMKNRDFYQTRMKKSWPNEYRSIFYSEECEDHPETDRCVRGQIIFGFSRYWYEGDSTVIQMISQTDAKVPVNNVKLATVALKTWVASFIKTIKKPSGEVMT